MNPKFVHRIAVASWILGGATLLGISSATNNLSAFAGTLWAVVAWIIWIAVVFCIAVPSPIGLVIIRTISPLAFFASLATFLSGDDTAVLAVGFAAIAVSTAVVFSGEFGHACVNASAYGNEIRFVLRPPVELLLPALLGWCLIAAPVVVSAVAAAAKSWTVFAVSLPVAVLLTILMPLRLAKLTTRWLVIVPAGLVIHDKVVLAETIMFRTRDITDLHLAAPDTEAADLTGVTWGVPVQIAVKGGDKIILAPTSEHPQGRALHVYSMLVAPSRPGLFLSSWDR